MKGVRPYYLHKKQYNNLKIRLKTGLRIHKTVKKCTPGAVFQTGNNLIKVKTVV
jgi:hypothetical protein